MNRDDTTRADRDAPLDRLAAELTLAAYRVALRTRTEGTWLELQLGLWRAMADTVETWGEIASASAAGDAARAVRGRSLT
jgi:hypothetical protein